MKVKDIIKHLEKYDEDDSILIAWWDREDFDPDLMNDPSFNWESACNFMTDDMDWSNTHDDIENALETFLKEEDAE